MSPGEPKGGRHGKGDKQRTVQFTYDTARVLGYVRERNRHRLAHPGAVACGAGHWAIGTGPVLLLAPFVFTALTRTLEDQ